MIQRIQSIWLLLAIACLATCFAMPVAKYIMLDEPMNQTIVAELNLIGNDNPDMWNQKLCGEPEIVFSQKQKDSGFASWPMIALIALTIAIAIASIFLYKNRMRQARIVMCAFVVNLAYVFLLFFWAVDKYANCMKQLMNIDEIAITWYLGAYLPIASLLFLFLAQRAIRKDEAKVRAADRLR